MATDPSLLVKDQSNDPNISQQNDVALNDDKKEQIPKVKELKLVASKLFDDIKKSRLTPDGFGKLKKKVLRELQHLQTLNDNIEYNSSNIHYLHSIWQTILNEGNNVCGIFKKYKYITTNKQQQNINILNQNVSHSSKKTELIVDIVCDDGLRWMKVKTSNPYSMQMQYLNCSSSSNSSKGKNIVTMADNFINAANQHQVYFKSPKIQFVFISGITSDISFILKSKGINVCGKLIKDDLLGIDDDDEQYYMDTTDDDTDNDNDNDDDNKDVLDESCVNLGVRTMLTMISSLSNGEICSNFFNELKESLLKKQRDLINGNITSNTTGSSANDAIASNTTGTSASSSSSSNLDFEYCDYNGNPYKNGVNIADNVHSNKLLNADGYTIGYSPHNNLNKFPSSSSSKLKRKKYFSHKSYEEKKMLLQMYIDEMKNPVLETINKCIANKQLICCKSAWNHFMDIVHLSAGINEWRRCYKLQSKIKIVDDQTTLRTAQLTGKSMSHTNKCVFGTGDSLKIITLTAIASFVRKAEQQGVKYFVHIHPVRPLTERYQTEYNKKRKQNLNILKQLNDDIDNNINDDVDNHIDLTGGNNDNIDNDKDNDNDKDLQIVPNQDD